MVERYLTSQEVAFVKEFVEVKGNVTTDTLEYADRVNADLIAIMTEQESSLQNLIMGTFAQQMITASRIPVLTVRPKQVLTSSPTK